MKYSVNRRKIVGALGLVLATYLITRGVMFLAIGSHIQDHRILLNMPMASNSPMFSDTNFDFSVGLESVYLERRLETHGISIPSEEYLLLGLSRHSSLLEEESLGSDSGISDRRDISSHRDSNSFSTYSQHGVYKTRIRRGEFYSIILNSSSLHPIIIYYSPLQNRETSQLGNMAEKRKNRANLKASIMEWRNQINRIRSVFSSKFQEVVSQGKDCSSQSGSVNCECSSCLRSLAANR